MWRRLWLLASLLLLHASVCGATTYYAQPGGSNTSCAAAQNATTAIATANAGAACLHAGDTLVLLDGTYNECMTDVIPSGTASQHTTVKAENQRKAVFTPPSTCGGGVAILLGCCNGTQGSAKSYITLQGLKISVNPDYVLTAFSAQGGLYPSDTDGAHDIWFLDLEASGCQDTGSISNFCTMTGQAGNGHDFIYRNIYFHDYGVHRNHNTVNAGEQGCVSYAMYISGWNNIIENNEFDHGCGFAIHGYSTGSHFYNNIIRNNYFHDIGAAALMMCGSPQPNYVYNNIIARTGVLIGVTPAAGGQFGGITTGPSCSGAQPNNNYIYNNTLVNVGASGELRCIALSLSSGQGGVYSGNNTVRNNICVSTQPSSSEGISNLSDGSATNVLSNNLCGTSGSNCAMTQDPQFVTTMPPSSTDYRAAGIKATDFQLKATSPALGAGLCDVASMATAFDGQTRPQPAGSTCDLGAWEMGGSPVTTLPPGLYLYWKLDEPSGTVAADATANNHPGTLTGTPLPGHIPARVGPQGLQVTGSGEHVETSAATPFVWPGSQQPVTLMFWVLVQTGGAMALGTASPTPNLFGVCAPCPDGYLYWQYGAWDDTTHTGGGSLYLNFASYVGTWAHVAVGADGNSPGQAKIWVNGQPQTSSSSFSAPTTAQTTPFEAGRWNKPAHIVNGNGKVDDVRLYTQYLQDTDVQALYRSMAGRVRRVEEH